VLATFLAGETRYTGWKKITKFNRENIGLLFCNLEKYDGQGLGSKQTHVF
jgi:hypothetical protein